MTKITSPLNSGQASGKYQNVVFARNRAGQYSRDYVAATNPDTADQQAWRDAFAAVSAAWNDPVHMTPERVSAWNDFANFHPVPDRFGQSRRLTGHNWFLKINVLRNVAGIGPHYFPPVTSEAGYLPDIEIYRRGNGDVVAEIDPLPTGDRIIYFQKVINQNINRSFRPNLTKSAALVTSGATNPVVLISDAEISASPKKQFLTYKTMESTGMYSPKVETSLLTDEPILAQNFAVSNNRQASSSPDNVKTTNIAVGLVEDGTNVRIIFKWDQATFPDPRFIQSIVFYFTIHSSTTFNVPIAGYSAIVDNDSDFISWNDRLNNVAWSTAGCGLGTDVTASATVQVLATGTGLQFYDCTSGLLPLLLSGDFQGLQLRVATTGETVIVRTNNYPDQDDRPYFEFIYYVNS